MTMLYLFIGCWIGSEAIRLLLEHRELAEAEIGTELTPGFLYAVFLLIMTVWPVFLALVACGYWHHR